MKILIIGGTGHVGNFLVPKLLKKGHTVYVGTRGKSIPRDRQSLDGTKFIECDSSSVGGMQTITPTQVCDEMQNLLY